MCLNVWQQNTVEERREVAIRCLIVYLGEKEEDLFMEFRVSTQMFKRYVCLCVCVCFWKQVKALLNIIVLSDDSPKSQ